MSVAERVAEQNSVELGWEIVFGKVRSKELRLNNSFDAILAILHVSNQMKAVHYLCIRFVINYVSLMYTILLNMFQ
jgi:hypothetical protein